MDTSELIKPGLINVVIPSHSKRGQQLSSEFYALAFRGSSFCSHRLNSYSFISLQGLDGFCFITVVLTNSFDAVIKVSKLELLVQLDCKLVDINIGGSRLGKHTFHLQSDRSAESLAFRAAEGECDLVDFIVISDHVLSHRERHRNRNGGLTLDLLFDRNTEDVDGNLVTGLLISKSKCASIFPWPVGVVEDFELDDLSHAWRNLKDLLGLALADSTSLFPAMLAVEVLPVVSAPLHLLFELLWIIFGPFAPLTHLVLELLHHFVERRTTMTAASSATTASSAASSTLEASDQLVDELHGILGCILAFLGSRGFFIKHGNHYIWSTTILLNLEESMLVTEALLTTGTVIEILAD